MVLTDESPGFHPAGKNTGVLAVALLFLAVVSVAVAAYFKSHDIDIKSINLGRLLSGSQTEEVRTAEEVYEIACDSKEHPVYRAYKDYIVKCNSDGISLLDKKGTVIRTEGAALNKPLAVTNGPELLVADIGGMDIYVVGERGVLWKDKTDALIISADINKGGYVTVVTESEKHNGEIRVYDPHGIELYRSVIANDFAVSAKISPSSGQMAINCMNANGPEAYSLLKYFDMDGNDAGEKSLESLEGIFPLIWYTDNESIIAAGDTSIAYLDRNKTVIWEKKFTNIAAVCPAGKNRIAAAVTGSGGMELKVFTAAGQELSSSPIDGRFAGMTSSNGIIAVNVSGKAMFFNDKGRGLSTYASRSDIADICILNSRQAAVITRTYIAVVDI